MTMSSTKNGMAVVPRVTIQQRVIHAPSRKYRNPFEMVLELHVLSYSETPTSCHLVSRLVWR
jgi:hypothetical protein